DGLIGEVLQMVGYFRIGDVRVIYIVVQPQGVASGHVRDNVDHQAFNVPAAGHVFREERVALDRAAHAVDPLGEHIATVGDDVAGLDPVLAELVDHPLGCCCQRPHGDHGDEVAGRELELDHQCGGIGRAHADGI